MKNSEAGWDLTIATLGEKEFDYNAMMEEFYSDPEVVANMDARNTEALEHQMSTEDSNSDD